MKGRQDAKRFARAFVGKVPDGEEKNRLGELKAFAGLFRAEKQLKSLFLGPMFSDDEKASAMKAVVEAVGLTPETAAFLETLRSRNRLFLLNDVAGYAETFLNERMKLARATVTAAAQLPAEAIERLRGVLAKWTGKTVSVDARVDEDLLGGLVVRVGSQVFDASIKGQMNKLREELVKG